MRHPALVALALTVTGTVTALASSAHGAADACAADALPEADDPWGAIGANPELSTFAEIVDAAGATELLTGAGPVTVLAPTNTAFDAIPQNILDSIVADAELLATVVEY